MSLKVGMPNLGHTMEEGTVSAWLKSIGDSVDAGEVMATVESDKATFEIESPADGVILAIEVEAGTTVRVGTTIGVVGKPGELPSRTVVAPPSSSAGNGGDGVPSQVATAGGSRPARNRTSTPLARRIATQLGIDLADVTPAGSSGVVRKNDVVSHAAAKVAPLGNSAPLGDSLPDYPTQSADKNKAGSGRRAIAKATQSAWQSIPHVTLTAEAEVAGLVRNKVPLTAAVGLAAAHGLVAHPSFNGWWLDEDFRPSPTVQLAFAVATSKGVMTAVVSSAERTSIYDLHAQVSALGQAGRDGRLKGEQTSGGSFLVSSLGRWGVSSFSPLISEPQVAVLGVGRVRRVAKELTDGIGVRFTDEVTLNLVFDHRANDGVAAAEFLRSIVANFERLSEGGRL